MCIDEEPSVIDLNPEIVDELLESSRIEELQEYIEESWKGWGNEHSEGDDTGTTNLRGFTGARRDPVWRQAL